MLCLTLAAFAAGATTPHAEISADPTLYEVGVIVLGIIEGPDPIPQVIWAPVRDIDPVLYLNPDGAGRGDGRPDIFINPVTGSPHVVWAYDNGSDFDIAYSYWTGSGWRQTEFITASVADELDPRIFIDDDAIYVVWWEPTSSAIGLIKREHLGEWQPVESVGGLIGERPSVVTWGGTVFVASERDDGMGGTDIVLSTRVGADVYDSEIVGNAPDVSPLDVVLHTEQGKLWMDWRHSSASYAYSEHSGSGWNPAASVPWTETNWVQLEEVRLCIRNMVMSAP
jgi:hypothetical protein